MIIVRRVNSQYLYVVSALILFFFFYLATNHLPLSRYTIPFLPGENLIPFLPWTFVLYLSLFVQGIIILKNAPVWFIQKSIFLFMYMALIGFALFLIIPIHYPRDLYSSNNTFIVLLRFIDGSGNCFPSLHVASTIIFAFAYSLLRKQPIYKILMWLWTILITVSVLTTKQHYIVDILGGILLAIPFAWKLSKEFSKTAPH